ncbi:Oidioi.mRNA.OKI2018_I69.PAR.g12786.t1.cds [Oikopleura dioica]|uniref:Oidioi.mRNA.OKI2018_I69.PAR.g12786.t1.cds n=1 Tax=Oikopleura dioica TaxID=34765 RepID=A0ABN7S1Q2_OIKDI|nr:Oidioi.mRNA.OKI2018_I69.PAR.g12786.t1.cds [Oikopleura dioica]
MPRAKTRKSSPQRLRSPSPGLRLVSQVYHRDILWKRGDLVMVVEDNEEYVAQIRAVVLSRLSMPGVIIRWLLPGPKKTWEIGPDHDLPIELSCLTALGPPPKYLKQLEVLDLDEPQWHQVRLDTPR